MSGMWSSRMISAFIGMEEAGKTLFGDYESSRKKVLC
jgi:hypothetical protein